MVLAEEEEKRYDFIAYLDCLHDMEDPQGVAAHTLKRLKKPDATVMIVEPFANDRLQDNLNPIGRLFYAASTMVCIPHL
jgi:2-polyprenyl-3-methyl-5-hydroxy-6-metoxy-1,4-benzoquinol methylase